MSDEWTRTVREAMHAACDVLDELSPAEMMTVLSLLWVLHARRGGVSKQVAFDTLSRQWDQIVRVTDRYDA